MILRDFLRVIEIGKDDKLNIYRMGNNPMVGATVAVAVSVEEAARAGKF